MCFFDKSNLIYIFDSVRLYVSNGRPQFSTDLDQIWRAASLYLQMVTMGFFLQRNRATPEHQGQFLNASRRRNRSSYQPGPTCGQLAAAVDVRACRHSSDNSCGVKTTAVVSNAKACVCGLWDAHPIVVVAQRLVDWKLVAGQLNTVSGTNSTEFITHPTSTEQNHFNWTTCSQCLFTVRRLLKHTQNQQIVSISFKNQWSYN